MIPDEATLMAYADGELDALTAKRVERAIAADPALGQVVADHRALRATLADAFAPLAMAPVPDRLTALLATNVVPLAPPAHPPRRRWIEAAAIAACLVIGIAVGRQMPLRPDAISGGRMVASKGLAAALDTQLASASGATRMLVSFRDAAGGYCRVFAAPSVDGIACRDGGDWIIRRADGAAPGQGGAYRQAGSADAALMAAAQNMMAGDPLDAAAERKARDAGWH